MFEFHGWVSIKEDDSDDADIGILDARLNEITDQIENQINKTEELLSPCIPKIEPEWEE